MDPPDSDEDWTPFDLFAYLWALRDIRLMDGSTLLDRSVLDVHIGGLLGMMQTSDRVAAIDLMSKPKLRLVHGTGASDPHVG